MKKIVPIFLVMGLMLGITPVVFAETNTATNAEIQVKLDAILNLKKQIEELQKQINVIRGTNGENEKKQKNEEDQDREKKKIENGDWDDKNENLGSLVKLLRQGSSGDDVKILQALLASDSTIYPEGFITGYYGPVTAKAVIKFQEKHNLEKVGNVGPKTLKKLNEEWQRYPVIITASSTLPCAVVPPGHLIAPGWLKKNDGVRPLVAPCQVLPPGIAKKLGIISTTTPPVVSTDTTAPLISNITVSDVSPLSAKINFNTNEFATTKVQYGTTTPLQLVNSVSGLRMNHQVSLTGLLASTTYSFVILSSDVFGNNSTSSISTFMTQ